MAHDVEDKDHKEKDEQPDAPYATSPKQIDEHPGPKRVDSAYGGAEYKNVERTGTELSQEPQLQPEERDSEDMATGERGVGLSSGAGQSGAGNQTDDNEEEPGTKQEQKAKKSRLNRPSYQGPEDRRI